MESMIKNYVQYGFKRLYDLYSVNIYKWWLKGADAFHVCFFSKELGFSVFTSLFRCSLFTSFLTRKLPCHLGGTEVVQVCGCKMVAHNHLKVFKYFCIVSLK